MTQWAKNWKGNRRSRPASAVGAVAALIGAVGLVVGCGVASASSPKSRPAVLASSHVAKNSKATSKEATLPQCGAGRDPFDPTDSGPPTGSPGC